MRHAAERLPPLNVVEPAALPGGIARQGALFSSSGRASSLCWKGLSSSSSGSSPSSSSCGSPFPATLSGRILLPSRAFLLFLDDTSVGFVLLCRPPFVRAGP